MEKYGTVVSLRNIASYVATRGRQLYDFGVSEPQNCPRELKLYLEEFERSCDIMWRNSEQAVRRFNPEQE